MANGTLNDTVVPRSGGFAFAQPPVNRPPNTMLGVGWTHGAFRDATPPAVAYQVHFHEHWACAGAPLNSDGTTAPLMTYETDAADFEAVSILMAALYMGESREPKNPAREETSLGRSAGG